MANNKFIYVASQGDDDAGHLRGQVINLAEPLSAIMKQLDKVIEQSSVPTTRNWVIQWYEGFSGVYIHENENIEQVVEVARQLDKHGRLFGLLLDRLGGVRSVRKAIKYLEMNYLGVCINLQEIADRLRPRKSEFIPEWFKKGSGSAEARANLVKAMLGPKLVFSFELDGKQHYFTHLE